MQKNPDQKLFDSVIFFWSIDAVPLFPSAYHNLSWSLYKSDFSNLFCFVWYAPPPIHQYYQRKIICKSYSFCLVQIFHFGVFCLRQNYVLGKCLRQKFVLGQNNCQRQAIFDFMDFWAFLGDFYFLFYWILGNRPMK